MAHQHRITKGAKIMAPTPDKPIRGKALASSLDDPQPSYPLATPDPLLPLLDPHAPVDFAHQRIAGRVFGQLLRPGEKTSHPTDFYVEFPAHSGQFSAINIRKLVGILGEVTAVRSFTRTDVARVLSSARPGFEFEKLLRASRP